jgi:hypothetical protein
MLRAFLCLSVLLLSAEGLAVPLCDNDPPAPTAALGATAPQGMTLAEDELAEADGPADEHVLIPCAFVDSGVYGPVCLDASGYLVTTNGVVLCEVRGLPDEGVVEDEREVESVPTPSGLVPFGGGSVAALLGDGLPQLVPVASVHATFAPTGRVLGPGRLGGAPAVPPA